MSTTKDRFPCSGIEGCRLRYLKFKCIDEPSTLEFYTTLGMTLDGRCSFGRSHSAFRLAFRTANVEFNENSVALIFETPNKAPDGSPDGQRSSGRPPSLRGSGSGPSGGNGNGSGNILGAYPTPLPPIAGNAATSPGGTATPGSTGSPGGSRPRRMSRSRAGGMVSAQSRSGAAASGTATTAPNGHDQGNDNNGANKPVLFDRTCPRDYLVVYVHFLPRIIKRLHSKGFRAILAFTTVPTDAAISYAIYLDPNGIELRLVEMPDVYLNEVASKSPWFARVGYYLTHVPSADDARHFLESLFSKQRRTPAMVRALQTGGGIMGGGPSSSSSSGGGSGNAMSFQMSAGAGSLSAPGGSSKKTTAADRFYQRDGVRLVDQEDIATGLQQTRYVWLGQVARDKMGTLCVCERAGVGDRGAAGALAAAAAATSIAAHAAAKNDGNGGNSRGFGSNGSSEQPQAAATVAVVTAAAIAAEMAGGMGGGSQYGNGVKRDHRLLAFGVEVGCTLDQAITQIVREAPESLIVSDERWRAGDIGFVARARGQYDLPIELVSVHEPFPGELTYIKLGLGAPAAAAAAADASRRGKGPHGGKGTGPPLAPPTAPGSRSNSAGPRSKREPYINFNQPLRTVLSESAICRVPAPLDPTDDDDYGRETLLREGALVKQQQQQPPTGNRAAVTSARKRRTSF